MAQPWFLAPFKNWELWRAKLNEILAEIAAGVNAGITQLTGDVTTPTGGGSQPATISNNAVSNVKLADMAQATVKGRAAGAGTGDPTDLTQAQLTALVNSFTDVLSGAAPASGGGTTNYLRADGSWSAPPGSGSGISQLTGDVTAGPGSGSQPATIANDAVTNAKLANMSASAIKARKTGSTGDPEDCTLSEVLDFIGSAAQGDILYRGASAWARLGAGTSGQFLKTQGGGANPVWATVTKYGTFKVLSSEGSATFQVNSTSYISIVSFEFLWDLDSFPFTHYRLAISGGSSGSAGQTISAQLATPGAPGTPIHTGGDDITGIGAGNLYDSGWLSRDDGSTGHKLYVVAVKGTNLIVDLSTTYIQFEARIV